MTRRFWNGFAHPTVIHPWRWRLVTLWVTCFSLAVAWAVSWGWQAHQDLCQTKHNTLEQIHQSEKYLDDVAHGRREPVRGITNSDITNQVKRQKAYAASIHCSTFPF